MADVKPEDNKDTTIEPPEKKQKENPEIEAKNGNGVISNGKTINYKNNLKIVHHLYHRLLHQFLLNHK